MDGSAPLDPRKTIFVGGVPRPLRAIELAIIMDRLYGSVCYAGIDTDPELKYPKGAGRVAFRFKSKINDFSFYQKFSVLNKVISLPFLPVLYSFSMVI